MVMALTAAAAAATRPPPPTPRTTPLSSPQLLLKPSSSASLFPTATTSTLSLFALFASPPDAKALDKDQMLSSLTQVEKIIDQVQGVGSNVVDAAQRAFQVTAETVKPGVDAALPILKQAGEQALKISSPAVSEASKKAQEAIQSSGFDTQPVVTAAKTVADAALETTKVIEGAKPIASSTVETILSADPVSVLGAGGALFLAYLVVPPIWSAISFSLRGYKGELTSPQALDLMCTSNYLMIDIRSEKDKNKAGIARLPSTAKNKVIAIPLEELPSKLKGLVRNAKKVEAELAALKISYLKKINKGSNIVIMDSYSDSAKIVARTLTSLGFKNCWIVADGFSGRKGWSRSGLGTDSYNLSFAEVLSPSRIIPAVQRLGTVSSGKLLPGGSD
ncbi:calcium sensing receptor, chloroplastic [Diospyros lotus]|uniref:calcium sensing receptor, chloroplastic n=1 Tax=Diospyros lotus TaxID=55363 RepID=UPI002256CD2D|nr:calcium sensing receptor, chloroplastic [Diospyros lotus]